METVVSSAERYNEVFGSCQMCHLLFSTGLFMPSTVISTMQGPLCGTLVTMLLYGVICIQVFHYVNNYGRTDRRAIKWLVAYTWFLETMHTAFSFHFVEYYLILHFNEPEVLKYEVWSMGATYICGFLVVWVANLLFVWRVWQLSKQKWICLILASLATVRAGIGIANALLGLKYREFTLFVAKVYPTIVAGWALAAFADNAITLTLCYYLRKQRSGMKRTDHIINTLLLYTINTGALTSLVAILVIISFLTLPGMTFTSFVQVQNKLYAVSILASFNARRKTLEDAQKAFPTVNNLPLSILHTSCSVGRSDLPLTPSIIEAQKDEEETSSPSNASPYA